AFLVVDHPGGATRVALAFPTALRAIPIPDEPTTVAFAEGAVVLAGLVDHEVALHGAGSDDPADATRLLAADDERQWTEWLV
ncbi:hypothetical protein ACQUZK_10090, partial [Streptococcus pyogenes]|uniref:hypothetical protein n=1 Tax=Streptococcus pyogenes TaxID=1314 RepID=UPI003D9FD85F